MKTMYSKFAVSIVAFSFIYSCEKGGYSESESAAETSSDYAVAVSDSVSMAASQNIPDKK